MSSTFHSTIRRIRDNNLQIHYFRFIINIERANQLLHNNNSIFFFDFYVCSYAKCYWRRQWKKVHKSNVMNNLCILKGFRLCLLLVINSVAFNKMNDLCCQQKVTRRFFSTKSIIGQTKKSNLHFGNSDTLSELNRNHKIQ